MFTREQAKVTLKRKGWTYRSAAPVLEVSYQHLCMVITGKRKSRRLLAAIESIPSRTKETQS